MDLGEGRRRAAASWNDMAKGRLRDERLQLRFDLNGRRGKNDRGFSKRDDLVFEIIE